MKTYVITLSQRFMKGHPKAGEETNFKEKFLFGYCQSHNNQDCNLNCFLFANGVCFEYSRQSWIPKIHTIRANYPLWEKRIKEVQDGKACLSIRQWSGKPYNSPQIEIARLTKEDGVGIQKLEIVESLSPIPIIDDVEPMDYGYMLELLAMNDGLSLHDWGSWFKGYDLSKPLAIIHFTKFRY